MAKIAITENRVFQVPADPAQVYAWLSQPEMLQQAMVDVERCEILADDRVHWVLKERVDQGIRFQPDFVVTYSGNGSNHVSCRFVEGNMANEWDAWITPAPEGSQISYRESIEPDLPITALMARLITPLVVKELRNDVDQFLDRVRQQLASRPKLAS